VFRYAVRTSVEPANVLGALSDSKTATNSSKALDVFSANRTATNVSKALGALAVAQRDISRAQFCAREIVATLRRPRERERASPFQSTRTDGWVAQRVRSVVALL